MYIVNATEFQNNFGKYLQIVQNGEEVAILKNGREVARLISTESSASFLTGSLTGILKKAGAMKSDDYEDALQMICAERIKADYIVTRNTADRVPVITPYELIGKLQ